MKKALDQTVRDLKKEVNKMVLKVPSIEQKTLDATSNEARGPRGSLMAEIAQATCNYNDYQLIMTVLWKRIQDTGKNWRHVYKALTLLEYLVIYGSERVIDDTREHAYQISTLSDFLYTDSNGRDQGSNVRRKSQSLVALVNNKESLKEVRRKALSNKDNRPSWPPVSSSARYNGGHFEGHDANREDGLVRERDLVFRDKDRYRTGEDRYSQGLDQYGKDFYSRDDIYRVCADGDCQYRPRSQSLDGNTNNSLVENDRHSTRSHGGKDDEILPDERIDAPPSYEEATNVSWSDVQNDKGTATASMQKASLPSGPKETFSIGSNQAPGLVASEFAQVNEKENVSFDEFDPRGSISAAPTVASSGLELDNFGLSAIDYTHSSASMLVTSTSISDDDSLGANFAVASTAHAVPSEPDNNSFGDNPFKAIPREDFPSKTKTSASATSQASSDFVSVAEINLPVEEKMEAAQSYDFSNTLGGPIYAPNVVNDHHSLANPDFYASEFSAANSSKDTLDGILPWTGPVASVSFQETHPAGQFHFLSQQGFSAYSGFHAQNSIETGSQDLQIGQINPFEQPELSNHLAGQTNPFEFQPFQLVLPSEIDVNQMNYTENSIDSLPKTSQGAAVSSHTFEPASLTGMQASQMISMDKQGLSSLQTAQSTSVTLHASQSTAPANYQGFRVNLSQQQILSSQAIPLASRIDSHVARINNLNQPALLAPQTLQLASGPFQAVHSSVPVNGNVKSAQLAPFRQLVASDPQLSLCIPVSSQPFQSSAPTIIQAAQINLQPFRPAASTSIQEAQIALKNIPVSSQATPSNIHTIQPSFTPHSALPDPTISSQGSAKLQPSKKFEPKSAVWADTINRGLVNLNISGPKTNSLVDIGIDFDDINRKEKRNEVKSSQTPLPSSLAMGKAMGAGSGLGRAGTGLFTQPLNPTVGSNMGMGMNQPYIGMGMGMNMGTPQQGHAFPGSYNTMNARGGYGQHLPYGRGGYT